MAHPCTEVKEKKGRPTLITTENSGLEKKTIVTISFQKWDQSIWKLIQNYLLLITDLNYIQYYTVIKNMILFNSLS